jgi:phosphoribosylformimino-5-aminoimidazole carboxamide ribotide isomerase
VVIGLDYRRVGVDGDEHLDVAVRGWEAGSGLGLLEVVGRFSGAPVAAIVATDIGQDGTLEGPDLVGYAALLASTALPVVASGGVGTIDHLHLLRDLSIGGRSLAGAIVGKALVEGAFTVEEAVAACRP